MIKINNIEISQEDLIKEVTKNKELMEALQAKFDKKESEWFVPKDHEGYYFLDDTCYNYRFNLNDDILERNQVYRTEKEVKKADNKRKAKVRILKRIAEENAKDGWVCDWSDTEQPKYFFQYYHPNGLLEFDYFYRIQKTEIGFYMSEKVAKKLQEELLADYKIYLGVK